MATEKHRPPERKPGRDDLYKCFKTDESKLKALIIRESRIAFVWAVVLLVSGPVVVTRVLSILARYGF